MSSNLFSFIPIYPSVKRLSNQLIKYTSIMLLSIIIICVIAMSLNTLTTHHAIFKKKDYKEFTKKFSIEFITKFGSIPLFGSKLVDNLEVTIAFLMFTFFFFLAILIIATLMYFEQVGSSITIAIISLYTIFHCYILNKFIKT